MKILSFLSFILFVGSLSNSVQSQPFLGLESNNLRIDPEWVETFQSSQFCWAYDVIVDKDSNTYSTGYFQRALLFNSFQIIPNAQKYGRSDIFFLIKRNSEGKLLWISFAHAQARPTRMKLDEDGSVLVLGLLMSDTAYFVNSDSSIHTLVRGPQSGIFLCRYNPDGYIIKSAFLSEHDEYPNDFSKDKYGNIYIVGARHFRRANNPSLQQRRLIVTKIDADWNIEWRSLADTLGQSHASAVTTIGKKVYLSGTFRDTSNFGKITLKAKNYHQRPLLLALNRKGKFLWAKDSVASKYNYVVADMCQDSKGNLYTLSTSSYSYGALSKFNKKGKLIWALEINGKATVYTNRLIIDKADNLYLCGESYGAVFGSKGVENYSYLSAGGTDPYIASYSSDGVLRWLKVFGGSGTDYCKSIALNENSLYAFGWTNIPFNFFAKKLDGKRGYLFYEAKFKLADLERIDNSINKEFIEKKEVWPKIASTDCSCTEEEKKKLGYAASLYHLASYSDFINASGWRIIPHDSVYKSLFYTGLQNSHSHGSSFNNFNLISFKTIKFVSPDSSYTLHINPCTNPSKRKETNLSISSFHGIKQNIYSFDESKFDSSALTYIDLILEFYSIQSSSILKSALFDNYEKSYAVGRSEIKKQYGIEWSDQNSQEEILTILSNQLDEKDIDLSQFIYELAIVDSSFKNKKHRISALEKVRIERILYRIINNFELKNFDYLLHPVYSVRMANTQLGISINPDLLHVWDPLKGEVSKDESGKLKPAYILADGAEFEYKTDKGASLKYKSLCFQQSEIGNTQVLLDIQNFTLVDGKLNAYSSLPLGAFPLNFDEPKMVDNKGYPSGKIPTELAHFSGLYISKSRCTLPLFSTRLSLSTFDIAVNNNFIAGHFNLPYTPRVQEDNNATWENKKIKVNIEIDGQEKTVSIEEIEAEFKKLGFTDISIENKGNRTYIIVYFLYRKP